MTALSAKTPTGRRALLSEIRNTIQSLSSTAADIHGDVSSLLDTFNTVILGECIVSQKIPEFHQFSHKRRLTTHTR